MRQNVKIWNCQLEWQHTILTLSIWWKFVMYLDAFNITKLIITNLIAVCEINLCEINLSTPELNHDKTPDDNFKYIFICENLWVLDIISLTSVSWWRHKMETFSTLLAICVGNSPVPGEFSTQRPVMRSFDVYFDLRPNKWLSKQSWGWWFETLLCSLWRHHNVLGCY